MAKSRAKNEKLTCKGCKYLSSKKENCTGTRFDCSNSVRFGFRKTYSCELGKFRNIEDIRNGCGKKEKIEED